MRGRLLTLIGILSPAIVVASVALHAQTSAVTQRTGKSPLTAWGDPDLRGIWGYATMTPLERARELAEKAVFTEEEAAAYERRISRAASKAGRDRRRSGLVGRGPPREQANVVDRRSAERENTAADARGAEARGGSRKGP